MPIYEYTCTNCRAQFEALRAISQVGAPMACPHCGQPDAAKGLSLFAAVTRERDAIRASAGRSTGGCESCRGGHCTTCSSHCR